MNGNAPTATPFAAQLEAARERAKLKLGGIKWRADELHAAGDGAGLLALFAENQDRIKHANDEYHFAHWLAERGIEPPTDADDWAMLAILACVPDERDPAKIARAAAARYRELRAAGAQPAPASVPVSAPEVPAQPPAEMLAALKGASPKLVLALWGKGPVLRSALWREVWHERAHEEPEDGTIDTAVKRANERMVDYCEKNGGPLYHVYMVGKYAKKSATLELGTLHK